MPKSEERESTPATEVGERTQQILEAAEDARNDAAQAESMLEHVKDPEKKKRYAEMLVRLKNRVEGLGDPEKLAEAMLAKLGPAAFEKKETPPEMLN